MNAFSRRTSSLALSSFLTKRQLRNSLAAACLAVAAGACYAQGTQMVVLHSPISTFGSGGNPGLIQVAEENGSGTIVTSPNNITLTISNGGGTFTTGTTTSGITPTYTNGIATFDLETLPLYASPSNVTYTLAFSDTGSGSPSVSPTVTVTTVNDLFIVTSFADTIGTCTNWNTVTSTPSSGSLDTACTLRTALTNISNATATAYCGSVLTCSSTNGEIVTSVAVNSTGGSYSSAPTVSFSGGGGTGAAATANLTGSAVTSITVTNGGSGYTTSPTVTLSAPQNATSSNSATIAFSPVLTGSTTWPQTITLASSLGGVNWYTGLTVAGPGVNNLIINGANTGTNGFQMFKEHSGGPWGTMNLSGMTLENGYISSDAAALYLYGTTNVWNVYFYKNAGTASGGAVYWPSTATSAWVGTFNYCVFDSNSDTSNGGAMADGATNGSIVINNSLFYNNTSSANGGAINISGTLASTSTNVYVTISNSTFTGNSVTGATWLGGALNAAFNSSDAAPASVNLINDTFYNNSTTGSYGGAIYVNGNTSTSADYTTLYMTDTTIVGNTNSLAAGKGGGLYGASGSAMVIDNSLIEGNQVTGGSGTNPDGYYTTANTHTINTSLDNFLSSTPSSYAYPGLASLGLSNLGSYGGPQLSIFTGGSYNTSGIPGASSTLAAVPTLVPLPGSAVLKLGSGSNQTNNSITTSSDARSVARPTTGSTNIDVGAVQTAGSLTFSTEPTNVNTGATYSPSPVVSYTDNGYSLNSSTAPIPIALTQSAGTLSGTVSANMTSGSVTFSGLSSTTPEASVTLGATAGTGTYKATATSNTFSITAVASNLVFTSVPTAVLSSGSSSTGFNVNIEDGSGNTIPGSSAQVNLAITGPAGYAGYNTSVNASSGVASFSGLPVLTIPGSYTYTVTSTGLTQATKPETVNINTTTLTLGESSSTNAYGSQDLLTATLSPSSQGSASTNGEIVTFLNNGTSVGTGTLSGGTATLSTANLPTGSNSLTASYAGDTSFSSSSASALVETSTPAPSSTVSAGTATATLTFTQNFTLGSITIVNTGTSGTAFTNSGGGTCAVSGSYGPGGTASCTVGVNYSASGGGLQTATVEVFDNNGVLQGAYNVVTPRYR